MILKFLKFLDHAPREKGEVDKKSWKDRFFPGKSSEKKEDDTHDWDGFLALRDED